MTPPIPPRAFDPAGFDRRIAMDDTVRNLMIAVAVVAALVAVALPGVYWLSGLVAPGVMVGLWLWWSTSTAKAGQALSEVGELMTSDPEQAERAIDRALGQRPVMRWARLLAYHRLAGLYHLQRRFADSAAICLCLLNQPLRGPAAAVRPHLLLMLAEAQLEAGNLPGAYHALAHLHQTRLGLGEALQRLALQTRYEVAAGADDAALDHARAKVELAELMPPSHGAAMHAMLATAAGRTHQHKLADWLWQRTRLLAPKALLDQLERGTFGTRVVEHHTPDPAATADTPPA